MTKKNKNIVIVLFTALIIILSGCEGLMFDPKNLDAPKNVKATKITCNSAVVSWQPVDNADYYDINWYAIDGYGAYGSKVTNDNGIMLNDLLPEQTYSFSVMANPHSDSKKYMPSTTTTITFTTLEEPTPEGQFDRPKNVSVAKNNKGDGIKISWDAVEGAVYYNICLEYEPNFGKTVKKYYEIKAPQTSYEVIMSDEEKKNNYQRSRLHRFRTLCVFCR